MLTVLLAVSALTIGQAERAAAQNWDAKYEEIHQMYYIRGQQREAIQALEDQIESAGNNYSDAVLKRILVMLQEYFTISKDMGRFEKLIFAMLEPNRVNEIVDHFKGTPMYDAARKARRDWMQPKTASIVVGSDELDIGDSTNYSVTARNQKNVRLSRPNVTLKLTPDECARIEGGKIIAMQPGKVTVSVIDPDGNVLDQREITVREGLGVSVVPDYLQLDLNGSETFTIQSNKPLDKFPIRVQLEPKGALEGSEFPVEPGADKKMIRITAKKPGTSLIKVTDPQGTPLAQATVYVPVSPPSMLWPLVGSAVTVGAAVFAFIERGKANDKFDEHKAAAEQIPPGGDTSEADALFSDYEDTLRMSNIMWVVTGVAAAGTGYLWWKYLQAKGEYDKKVQEETRPVSFLVNPVQGRVVFTYSF